VSCAIIVNHNYVSLSLSPSLSLSLYASVPFLVRCIETFPFACCATKLYKPDKTALVIRCVLDILVEFVQIKTDKPFGYCGDARISNNSLYCKLVPQLQVTNKINWMNCWALARG
jgi:hypothetical protein